MGCIVDFLESNLPPIALAVLVPIIVPMMTTNLTQNWLENYIPSTLNDIPDLEKLVDAAKSFEGQLHSFGWSREYPLHEWTLHIGEIWGNKRKVEILEMTRDIIRRGVLPNSTVSASAGAIEYEDTANSMGGDWSWEEDWTVPSTSSSSTTNPRRKLRHSIGGQRMYECTAIAGPLRTLLASLLQEYTHLSNISLLQSAQTVYPSIFRHMFSLYRASGMLHASTTAESPIRLVNDCFYLAGEIGLMALGLGHMGYSEINAALKDISSTMDLCGVHWRERYLVVPFESVY